MEADLPRPPHREDVWERIAYAGVPKEKRHIKSTYANSTPATDGAVVVAFFGSQGLYAYDMKGELLWKQDLGPSTPAPTTSRATSGARPARHHLPRPRHPAVRQQNESFIGVRREERRDDWKTQRDELPSWATPTVVLPGTSAPS